MEALTGRVNASLHTRVQFRISDLLWQVALFGVAVQSAIVCWRYRALYVLDPLVDTYDPQAIELLVLWTAHFAMAMSIGAILGKWRRDAAAGATWAFFAAGLSGFAAVFVIPFVRLMQAM